jgi:hypothetical protein
MKNVNVVIWNELPFGVALWRKLFRSFKRYIGVIDQGSSSEKLHNVIGMFKKHGIHIMKNIMY